MSRSCVIIGSGLGGLVTGAIMARGGYRVTLLEQHSQIGGCLQCFSRNGFKFETGMHFIGSADEGQPLSRYLRFLNIKDKIPLSRLDSMAYDIVSLQGGRFAFANGREAMVERLAERFPSQRDALRKYWETVDRVVCYTPYRTLKPENFSGNIDNSLFTSSVNGVLEQCITDPLLREVLMGNAALYAAQRNVTPFSTHAFIADFYNSSAFRVVGGSDRIAQALAEEIQDFGGRIITGRKVVRICCEAKTVKRLECDTGDAYTADCFISDIHPSNLLALLSPAASWHNSFRNRLARMHNTPSVFSLFLGFKEGALPYMNSNFYGFRCNSPWEMLDYNDTTWPRGYLYMHHCMEEGQRFAQSGVVLAYMGADELSQWEHTGIGHRGADYAAFKERKARQLLSALSADFPQIGDKIAFYESATPLTYRDYTSTPDGSMYGLAKDVGLGVVGRISWRTKLDNLFMVGQNTNAHGALGVMVGAINLAAQLLGEEYVNRRMAEVGAMEKHYPAASPAVMKPDTLVMGGGLGGLFAAALLAKSGQRVLVLEKNGVAGGGLQCFRRGGALFPTGMHVFGGFQPGGQLRCLCSYLGIMDELDLAPTDDDAFDEIFDTADGHRYCLPKGRDAYVEYLGSLFPHERDNIRAYVDALYRLTEEEELFYLNESEERLTLHSDEFTMPADQFVAKYINDGKLRSLLSYITPLYAGVKGETPAYIHALINVLHINGSHYFLKGSSQLADCLVRFIRRNGGEVLTGTEVRHISADRHRVACVEAGDGRSYTATDYISDLHPDEMLRIIDPKAFPLSYRERIHSIPSSYSAFKVYVRFRPQSYPHTNHPCYVTASGNGWSDSICPPEKWPQCLMCMTQPDATDSRYAATMVIIVPMPFAWVRRWEESSVGKRGEEYEAWKKMQADKVLQFMEKTVTKGFMQSVAQVFTSSPLTIRDYLGNREGGLYGFHRDSNNLMLSRLSVYTKVENLYLTGQNINLHGMCGVALTAIATVCALLKRTDIISEIRDKGLKSLRV